MVKRDSDEIKLIHDIQARVLNKGRLLKGDLHLLSDMFSNRFERAMKIVKSRGVTKYIFTPSDRIVWTIQGRSDKYHVMPKILYCNCDDFYYRVLGGKHGVCYHLLAQFLAENLGTYTNQELPDRQYKIIISKLRPKIES
jgi:predicted nucleic acid-binding Zn finger protein